MLEYIDVVPDSAIRTKPCPLDRSRFCKEVGELLAAYARAGVTRAESIDYSIKVFSYMILNASISMAVMHYHTSFRDVVNGKIRHIREKIPTPVTTEEKKLLDLVHATNDMCFRAARVA
jgi:hypothetical protein